MLLRSFCQGLCVRFFEDWELTARRVMRRGGGRGSGGGGGEEEKEAVEALRRRVDDEVQGEEHSQVTDFTGRDDVSCAGRQKSRRG
eukprot:760429-Hanusia_phi.AAC.1